jgi:hypothetical protein
MNDRQSALDWDFSVFDRIQPMIEGIIVSIHLILSHNMQYHSIIEVTQKVIHVMRSKHGPQRPNKEYTKYTESSKHNIPKSIGWHQF